MNDLPRCGICGKQIVNVPSIGWYCPTINCDGDWPQKANIVFDYKTDAAKLKEAEKEIECLQKLLKMCSDDMFKPSGKISKKTAIELMKYIHRDKK